MAITSSHGTLCYSSTIKSMRVPPLGGTFFIFTQEKPQKDFISQNFYDSIKLYCYVPYAL